MSVRSLPLLKCYIYRSIFCSQVVVGAAVCGAVYAGLAYFRKDQDVADSFNRFGNSVESDARGLGRDLKAHGRDFRARADDKARDLNFR